MELTKTGNMKQSGKQTARFIAALRVFLIVFGVFYVVF